MSALPILDAHIVTIDGEDNAAGRDIRPVPSMIPAVIFRFRDADLHVVELSPSYGTARYSRTPDFEAAGLFTHGGFEKITPDLGNTIAREGYDRCLCGCKYWENDTCVDCGAVVITRVNGEPVFA